MGVGLEDVLDLSVIVVGSRSRRLGGSVAAEQFSRGEYWWGVELCSNSVDRRAGEEGWRVVSGHVKLRDSYNKIILISYKLLGRICWWEGMLIFMGSGVVGKSEGLDWCGKGGWGVFVMSKGVVGVGGVGFWGFAGYIDLIPRGRVPGVVGAVDGGGVGGVAV
ncbi:hypothetical protein Tco_1056048 [Tanacetum coccineum]|uniref:Uncharacterized protein n=1 Tax=Tanacetum coccineum TaxID=301880 RepID=A0ABQ5H1E2_9ASTR